MSRNTNEHAGAAAYFDKIDELTGVPGVLTTFGDHDDVSVMSYPDVPEPAHQTMFSFGLSLVPRKEWIGGRPELMLSVRSMAPAWVDCLGGLVYQYRSDVLFQLGSILCLGRTIEPGCRMTSMLVFHSNLLDSEQRRIELGGRIVNIVQLYPIYDEEGDLIIRMGVEKFFFELDIEFENLQRPSMVGPRA